jgi:hypothetical protein
LFSFLCLAIKPPTIKPVQTGFYNFIISIF